MKSFMKVLVVFFISQIVDCKINNQIDFFQSRKLVFSNIFDGLDELNIVENCDKFGLFHILYKLTKYVDELQPQQFNCNETASISKIMESKTELKSFFTNCINPKYIELVDKLHDLDSKIMKQRCETNDQELHEMVSIKDEKICFTKSDLQIQSCIFSEPELMQISKNLSKAVNFAVELFNGNDEQCGIVNRIEKCFLNSIRKCDDKIIQKKKHIFNITMKLFECKVNETINVS